ncbi:MAG: hypothetical protein CMF34_01940 [Leeuwenhoekiella sp.]|nr:hypothetical protein [Leeuwenhoekiella sp.]MBH13587.1 hypothetical protein [Leeuwenhoekiella sp.]HAX15735.1 hypothetical protein [Leeuwenhoekiella sp.]|tara:strand:+ start:9999 stop:10502 length:504 start_codon:yes stop_codon:yes gene_type:complete
MKTLLTLIAFVPFLALAQTAEIDHWYLGATIDPNNLLNVVDNPRMERDDFGTDFKIEAGAYNRNVLVYAFYNGFPQQDYTYMALGAGAYVQPFSKVIVSGSLQYGILKRQVNEAYLAWGARATLGYRIGRFTLVAEPEYQQRPDIANHGIFQLKVGVQFWVLNKMGR